jgi:hypothetical protein
MSCIVPLTQPRNRIHNFSSVCLPEKPQWALQGMTNMKEEVLGPHLNTQGAEEGGSRVEGQTGLHSMTLSQKKPKERKRRPFLAHQEAAL